MCSDSLSPTFCQVRPPSVDLYTPSPNETERCALPSPLPTQIVLELRGSMTTVPTEYDASLSKTGVQVVPELVVFQTPPDAAAMNQVCLFRGSTAISATRPDVAAGPI